ncbi:MAG: Gfo/Idh/MocA family oxidoreductase [Pseudomonadota bacterium]
MSLVRYGIIGCGMMGQEHLANIALLDDAEVGAIYEPDQHMREAAREQAPDAIFCESVDALLRVADINCLLIASPNHLHTSQFEQIANTRPLPLLIEKPLFTDPDDAVAVQNMARRYNAPIWVAMEYRYMPPIAHFLSRAQDVTGGIEMLTIREHRFPFLPKVGNWNRFNRNTGGTFVEKCCHFFDLMRLVLEDEPVRVFASGGQAVNHLDEHYDGQVPDILDHGYVMVEFSRGKRAMLELCMFAEGAEYQEEISAVGSQGKIEALVPGPGRFWPKSAGDVPIPKIIESPRAPKKPKRIDIPVSQEILAAGDHNGATFYQHQRFTDVVRGKQSEVDVSLWDGWMAVQMGLAAQEAIRLNRVVNVGELTLKWSS